MAKEYENGSHVAMEQALCPVCVKPHETGAILIDRRLKNTFEHMKAPPSHYGVCEECKKLYDDGYIAVVGIDPNASSWSGDTLKMEDAFRTGHIVHVKAEAWERVFKTPLDIGKDGKPLPMVFIDDKGIDMLQKMQHPDDAKKEGTNPS